jgi:hypothetical protein
MSIQVRDLITRLQQMPDQTAQVFIGAKIHGGEDVVELPLDYPDIRPWNPAKVHIRFDPEQVEEGVVKEHRAYTDLEEKIEDLQEAHEDIRLELAAEKENASKLKSALASIRREVNSVTDPD